MTQRFPPAEFDSWAKKYDQDTNAETGFPFTGYLDLLRTIFDRAACPRGSDVLDLGIGTGNLALLFANAGCKVWGLDFSAEMLKLARKKLPTAVFGLADLRAEWPQAFDRRFDAIVSAYTFHHFPIEEKVSLVKRLIDHNLNPGGKLLIGDIAFQNAREEAQMRLSLGEDWEQEYYWLEDETGRAFRAEGIMVKFDQISACAGVFEFSSSNRE
jgi:putative AdoMet-dependent methyltransferase